jgi:hypothetical protein
MYSSTKMGWFDDIADGFKSTFSTIGNGIKDGFNGFKDKVLEPVWNSGIKPLYNNVIKPIGEKALQYVQRAADRADKLSGLADRAVDASGQLVTGAGNAAEGIGNFLGGNSSTLLYIGLGVAGIIILPKLIDKVL